MIVNGPAIFGTTARNATASPNFGCGVSNGSPGTWYQFIGLGTVFEITTCFDQTDFGTAIQVFRGSCSSLGCVGGGNADGECEDNFFASSFRFDSIEGQLYHAQIFGRNNGDTGQFVVALRDFAPPENDLCVDATSLVINGPEVAGITVNATTSANSGCGVTNRAPDIWYQVVGNGNIFQVSTCSGLTDFSTSVQVFRGECGSLGCVTGSDAATGCMNALAASVQWDTIPNTLYHVRVFGSSTGTVGEIGVRVIDFAAPDNDLCENAVLIEPNGVPILGSTINATTEANAGCVVSNRAAGVWYRVEGNGNEFTASTCSEATDFGTGMQVYSTAPGACTSVGCVTGSIADAECGSNFRASRVTFPTTTGVTYRIFVFGRTANTRGNFALTVVDSTFTGPFGTLPLCLR